MTELLVSTKKGTVRALGRARRRPEIVARRSPGEPSTTRARPTYEAVLAATTSPFYGPKVFYTEGRASDRGAGLVTRGWSRPRASRCPQR